MLSLAAFHTKSRSVHFWHKFILHFILRKQSSRVCFSLKRSSSLRDLRTPRVTNGLRLCIAFHVIKLARLLFSPPEIQHRLIKTPHKLQHKTVPGCFNTSQLSVGRFFYFFSSRKKFKFVSLRWNPYHLTWHECLVVWEILRTNELKELKNREN